VTGFAAFLGKEFQEIRRTWRIWVSPGMLVFFAITSPLIALATPKLLSSLAGSQPGVVITMPEPTAADAYGQFMKNLSQLVILAIVIAGAGLVSSERSSGTALLVLTKPLSRAAFVLAKLTAELVALLVFTVLGAALCLGVTRLVFPPAPVAPFAGAVALWFLSAALLTAVMTLCSVLVSSRGGAAGLGLGYLFLGLLASIWPPAVLWSFVGLGDAMGKVLAGKPVALGWPVGTAVVSAVLATGIAMRIFERQEL
jgi:ABC-2 type transport system permease protein